MRYSNGREVVEYSKDLKIVNLEALPAGLNLPYLECIRGLNGELVAQEYPDATIRSYGGVLTLKEISQC